MFVAFPACYCSVDRETGFSYGVLFSKAASVTNSSLTLFNTVKIVCFSVDRVAGQELNSLPDMYSPGTLVRCIVTSIEKNADGRRSVKLSIDPKKVNKGLSSTALAAGMVRFLGLSQPPWAPAWCIQEHFSLSLNGIRAECGAAPTMEESCEERADLVLVSRLSFIKLFHLILFQYDQVV